MKVLSESAVDALRKIDTPTLANAIELLKVRPQEQGFTPQQIRCLFPQMERLCGFAVTAQVETITQSNDKLEAGYVDLFQAVEDSPKPAVVVLQEVGPHPDFCAHCGEVMATFFLRLGAEGLVTDAAVRDVVEVRQLGFKYFARGTVASHANFRIVRSNVPVHLMGLPVRPGELLHGDENGLISVPDAPLDDILRAVDSVRTRERKLMDYAKAEGFKAKDLTGRFFH